MPPCVKVTSLPLEELSVTGEEVPVKLKSVPVPELAAIVTIPFRPVPEVVRVMLAPSTSCRLPPELLSVTVCEVASEVLARVCNSFEVEPSTSVALMVTVPEELEIETIPEACSVKEPPPLLRVFV